MTVKTGEQNLPKALCLHKKNKVLKRIPTTWCDYLCTSSPLKEYIVVNSLKCAMCGTNERLVNPQKDKNVRL